MRKYARTCKGINIQLQSIVWLFDVPFAIKKFSFCGERGNEAFPKGGSWNQILPLLVIFHLPFDKYRGVKICFYSFCYQNQNFSPVLHSCRLCSTRVALVLHSCLARVTLLLLVSHSCRSCRTRVARVWRSCCKLN